MGPPDSTSRPRGVACAIRPRLVMGALGIRNVPAKFAQVAGIDHVGLGSDFAGTFLMPEGIKDVGDFPNITLELLKRGYAEGDIRKILGENTLRVMSRVESVSRLMRDDEPLSAQQAAEADVE